MDTILIAMFIEHVNFIFIWFTEKSLIKQEKLFELTLKYSINVLTKFFFVETGSCRYYFLDY